MRNEEENKKDVGFLPFTPHSAFRIQITNPNSTQRRHHR